MSQDLLHLLILDDDDDVAYAARLLLRRHAQHIATLAQPAQLPRYLESARPDVVLLDLNFTLGRTDGSEGLRVLDQLRALPQPPQVIVMTAYADVPLAVDAMKRGACDFVTKPWDNRRLLAAVESAAARNASAASSSSNPADGLMGDSLAMRQIRKLIAHVGPTEANVMVLGENGVGKELVARAIHGASRRAARGFLAVDMGTLPEATLESELFGHRKGSFTDARNDRPGRFQSAAGGTLFLDEIGNLPLPAQAKLLTALERREVTPLGADRPLSVDVRIVSATNLEESQLFDPHRFRPDLLFRLNTIVIRMPPLRERRDDIPGLLNHYLAHYQQRYEKPAVAVAPDAFDALLAHAWPGNVRALRHACERAVILGQDGQYQLSDFGLEGAATPSPAFYASPEGALASTDPVPAKPALGAGTDFPKLGTLEREAIHAALLEARGNISRAAKLLGVSRAALYRKLDKHGL